MVLTVQRSSFVQNGSQDVRSADVLLLEENVPVRQKKKSQRNILGSETVLSCLLVLS